MGIDDGVGARAGAGLLGTFPGSDALKRLPNAEFAVTATTTITLAKLIAAK